jgi:hypothetical protein
MMLMYPPANFSYPNGRTLDPKEWGEMKGIDDSTNYLGYSWWALGEWGPFSPGTVVDP